MRGKTYLGGQPVYIPRGGFNEAPLLCGERRRVYPRFDGSGRMLQ